jgi:DNA ligase D-like protein (predicted 3'-phosphoesterase)
VRLGHDGVLKSWAVPKGLPEAGGGRRLAIVVEDHPAEYIGFGGTIPEGGYGAGDVTIWDTGTFEQLVREPGRIEIILHGRDLTERYFLIRFEKTGDNEWLVLKSWTRKNRRSGSFPELILITLFISSGHARGSGSGINYVPFPACAEADNKI